MKIKTLKGKITAINFCLIIVIALLGIFATANVINLKKLINGLMINNYKSINAVDNMRDVLEKQNASVIAYIYNGQQNEVDEFYKYSDDFYRWYNIESNNITEAGEKNYVEKIRNSYTDYIKSFAGIQSIKKSADSKEEMKLYNSSTAPDFVDLRQELTDIAALNERAMINNKKRIVSYTEDSMNIILIISIICVAASLVLSNYFTGKFLKPVTLLTETMKRVKEGDLNQQAPVVFEDEIGGMAREFNNMTKRLQIFEESTLGKVIDEKNKSLAIVKSISDPIIVLDNNYKVILCNDACNLYFGVDENNVINKHFLMAIKDGELFDFITQASNMKEQDMPIQKMYNMADSKGNYYFNVLVTQIKDIHEVQTGVIVVFQNVTELKQVENMKSDFISTVSHEFKTPLTSIMFGTSLLLDKNLGISDERQMKILNTMKEDADRLLSLVNDLLRLSKIEYDKSIFKMKPCSIRSIIQDSIKEFYNVAESKGVNLVYDADKDLPKISGDFEKLTWAVNNLISNALKCTDRGDQIIITACAKENNISVEVRDTGIGIPEEYQNKIFDKFIQIKGQDSERRGTGLGLAITKQIIEAHSGSIHCKSVLGQGSIFTFTLPIEN